MAAEMNSKPNSFSFVTEATDAPLRFLADLPLRPVTPPTIPEEDSETTASSSINLSTSSSSPSPVITSTSISSSPRMAASPVLDHRQGNKVTTSSHSPELNGVGGSSSNSSASLSIPTSSRSDPTASEGSTSKSRKRLSTLSGLLKKDKSRSASRSGKEDGEGRSVSRDMSANVESGERSASSSRRPSIEDTSRSTASSRSPSPPSGPNGTSPRSKPPVSLPSLFRRRPSSSSVTSPTSPTTATSDPTSRQPSTVPDEPRRSIDRERLMTGLGLSSSSIGSSDGGMLSSDASTAATSPDIDTADVTTPLATARNEPLSGAEKRRRSSMVLATELSGQDQEEDLADFVRASGTTSPSPRLSSGPFARRPSDSFSLSPPPLASLDSSAISPTSASPSLAPEVPESTIASRRNTRNIENLSLGDLGRRSPISPTSTLPTNLPPSGSATVTNASTNARSAFSPSSVALTNDYTTRSRASTQARLQALPRLLSMDVIPSYGSTEEEAQEPDEETESDTEDGEGEAELEGESETATEDPSEDEGDQYASADEGPATSRNATPAQTPRAASRNPSIERFASTSTATPRVPSLTGLAMFASSSPGLGNGRPASSWVTFAPPTPGTVRTARPQPSSTDSANQSYFDLPRPANSSNKTPGIPPQTPLAPMSISDVARGKRPALQEEVDATATTSPRVPSTTATPTSIDDSAVRHGLYRLKSQSEVALMSPSMVDSDDEPVGTAAITGLDSVWRTGGVRTPGPSFLTKPTSPPKAKASTPAQASLPPLDVPQTPGSLPTPSYPGSPTSPITASPTQTRQAGRTSTGGTRLHRPRSMYELRDAPPAYTSIARQPGFGPKQIVEPREEEGKEGLPTYTCSIHIEGFMPRKMEFTSPGVQAKDRAWKRQYIVLHGTSIKVYKYDLRTHPIPGEEDWSVVPVDIAGKDGPPPLHFHQGEYGIDPAPTSRFPLSIEDAKAKAKSRIIQQATASSTNQLLRHYSLQNAESGLAADYIKRKHVVRVRAEGEQFLLQAKDDRGVIDLIEALQAATNVALDLDARPLPKFITLPRRRRRRRPRPDAALAAATAESAAAATAAAAATSAENRRRSPDRFADMAEEDRISAAQSSATVM